MNTLYSLTNKIILITGASSGIGKATAILLSKYNATLLLAGRNQEKLNETLSLLQGTGHNILAFDITDEQALKKIIDNISAIDGLVYSAGIVDYVPFKNLSQKDRYVQLYNVNVFSAIQLTSLLLKNKKINNGSSLVYISSISAKFGVPATTLYAGSKAALNSSIKVLASEVSLKKIRANTIMPGIVMTPMIDQAENLIASDSFSEAEKQYPLGLGKPEDIANACLFLLTDQSRWITGTSLLIDGGYSLI